MRGGDEAAVAAMFASDVERHRLIVKHDQGLYRHLLFTQREHSWCDWFELISTPGMLTIAGDHGTHSFRRDTDMFRFFRSNPDRPHRINPGYWAEKTHDHGASVKAYDEDLLRRLVDDHLQEAIRHRDAIQAELDEENSRQLLEFLEDLKAEGVEFGDPEYPAPTPERAEDWPELIKARELVEQAEELIRDYDADDSLRFEEGARDLLRELEKIGLVSDTWEWDLRDWDSHFLWCLNAIAWGIQQYDRAIRDGLHVVRTGPMPWDTPLPTTPPAVPGDCRPAIPPAAADVPPMRGLRTVAVAGGVL